MGKVRVDYVDYLEKLSVTIRKKGMHLLWVVDMPLFEPSDVPNGLKSAHHLFTAPNAADVHLLESAPLQVSQCFACEWRYPQLVIFRSGPYRSIWFSTAMKWVVVPSVFTIQISRRKFLICWGLIRVVCSIL